MMSRLQQLQHSIIECDKCPRLITWREKAAREKVKRFADCLYWGKPVPSFGDPQAQVILIGLAPAANGANRTGRMFTGDRSGEWLFRALHKAGFANCAESISLDDGLNLRNCYITAACRCAPPQNKLLPGELQNCRPYLSEELRLLKHLRVVIGLGKVGFNTAVQCFAQLNWLNTEHKPVFSHGAEYPLNGNVVLLGSYHPSQQNTFTGKLTEPMFDAIFQHAKSLLK
jgi:uracil-DNA glycosylase